MLAELWFSSGTICSSSSDPADRFVDVGAWSGQNFSGTLFVDGFGILLAAFGFLNPLLAAFIHVSSELLFILNSTRLLPRRR